MVRSKPLALVALLVAAFAVNLETTMVNVALPSLSVQLHASTTQLQWVVDAYNLAFAALLLTMGSLSDRLGRKGMLLAGLGVFGVATLVGSFSTSTGELIAARAVMGLGAAMVFPATLSSITNIFTERKERAAAIGLWGAIAGVAIALGPIAGGWLLEQYRWSSVFVAMAPVAAVGALLVALVCPTSRDPEPSPLDLSGLVLSVLGVGLLVFTVIEAPDAGWWSLRTVGGAGLAVALLAGFVLRERRTDAPMLDVALFRNPRFSAASASVTVAFFTLFGFIFLMTQYFQFVHGYSPLSTGLHLLPVALSVGAFSVVGTELAVRIGTKAVVAAGLACTTIFYVWVAGVVTATTPYTVIALQMVLYGIGMGFTSAPATESIMGAVSTRQAGVGSAVNDTTRLLGGTLGVAVIGSVYASLYADRLTGLLAGRAPAPVVTASVRSLGAARSVARAVGAAGHPAAARALDAAATNAFIHGLQVGCLVAGGVAAVGALMAVVLLPSQPPADAALASTVRPALAG
jgi:EmrB/QacA subfamily drug resistance transporter